MKIVRNDNDNTVTLSSLSVGDVFIWASDPDFTTRVFIRSQYGDDIDGYVSLETGMFYRLCTSSMNAKVKVINAFVTIV